MGKIYFLELSLGVIGLLAISLITFFILNFKIFPKIRSFTWFFFYLSMAGLTYVWFMIFFPEFMTFENIFLESSIFAWLALLSIIDSAFFAWLFLSSDEGKLAKIVAKWILIISLICLLAFTALGVNIKLEASVENIESVE